MNQLSNSEKKIKSPQGYVLPLWGLLLIGVLGIMAFHQIPVTGTLEWVIDVITYLCKVLLAGVIASFVFAYIIRKRKGLEESEHSIEETQQIVKSIDKKLDINLVELKKKMELGIEEIFPNRGVAKDEIHRALTDQYNYEIDMMGISLRDFLQLGRSFSESWRGIVNRLQSQVVSTSQEKKLRVRVLLIHPTSFQAIVRSEIEEPEKEDQKARQLYRDVVQKELEDMVCNMQNLGEFLQARLYSTAPFFFLIRTEKAVFIEQYCYKEAKDPQQMPLLKYDQKHVTYNLAKETFNQSWRKACKIEDFLYE